METAFEIDRPVTGTGPFVFSSPHSGIHYPESFLARAVLDPVQLRSSEDAFVDRLIAVAPRLGIPVIAARVPRAFVDLNRAPDELDPALIEGLHRAPHNPRISSGLGVIPRVVSGGRAIYRGKLSLAEAEERILRYWHPYHAALRGLIEETHQRCGEAVLIDWHSMPHEAIEQHSRPGLRRPEVVLGDRLGASAGAEWMDRVEAAFAAAGFVVARNTPFAGAFIAQSYGRPSVRRHVIQIEIDRALYMDEARIAPLPGFAAFQALIAEVIGRILDPGSGKAALLAAE